MVKDYRITGSQNTTFECNAWGFRLIKVRGWHPYKLGVSPAWGDIGRLVGDVHRIRGYGDFLHYHLLASGAIDMVIESDLNILDIAALAVIIREAGGDVTTLDGRPLDLESRTLLATNARLREPVNAYLTAWDDTRDGPQGF